MVKPRDPDIAAVARLRSAALALLIAAVPGRGGLRLGSSERMLLRRATRALVAGFDGAIQGMANPRNQASGGKTLSSKEKALVAMLSLGYGYKEIASKLGVSYTTVHSDIKDLYRRLGIHGRVPLVSLFDRRLR
ncbi:MAG: helix-turn-helix transcriptional regulator [Pseudomonadota bacterium]